MLRRNIEPTIRAALADTPVVLLTGARQTGKSTLARNLALDAFPEGAARMVTLDDATTLAAAASDPEGFIADATGPLIIDEVQRVPKLFLAIKASVDRDRRPGRFLLTGSAHALMIPAASTALVGRMEVQTLWPFSQGELEGHEEAFIDALFQDSIPGQAGPHPFLWSQLTAGGYPEAVARGDSSRRDAWFGSYITTILQRDVQDLAQIERISELPTLLSLIAARTANLLNMAELSRSSGLPATTLKRYLSLFFGTFLTRELPAWSSNLSKRLVKSPKLFVLDSGLAAHLVGFSSDSAATHATAGGLLETFVVGELLKQNTWSRQTVTLHHYRTHGGREVDVVLESPHGALVGLEVKASRSVSARDFRGLDSLRDEAPDRFKRGVVLYRGDQVVSFGRGRSAVPLNALWSW